MKGPTNSSARPNIRLLNVSATFESNPDTSNNTEFPYRASIQADGVSEYMSATVMFSQVQATSGNFATYCQTDEDVVYIYSKTDVGTITIPAVSCDLSANYLNADTVPTEDSQAVITSGGVYDALGDYMTLGTAQTITAEKTFSSSGYTNLNIKTGNTTGFLGGLVFKNADGTNKSWVSAGLNGDLYLNPTNNIVFQPYSSTFPNTAGLNNRFYFSDSSGNVGNWVERFEDANDVKLNLGVQNYTSTGGATAGVIAISKGTGKPFSWMPPQWQLKQSVRNPNFDVYARPSTYTFSEIQFVDKNDVPYMKIRATCDAEGSRRLEVAIMTINNTEHWFTLASRTD